MARTKRVPIPPRSSRKTATLRPPGGPRPPIAGPDAQDLGLMVTKYTLTALNNEGYINCTVPNTEGQLAKAYGHGAVLRYADEAQGEHAPYEPYHIHPCLQRFQWMHMDDDEDWEAILPSVELASRILDDPAITPFFAGLMEDKIGRLDDPILRQIHKKDFQRWDFDNKVMEKEEDMAFVLYAMMQLRDQIMLGFRKTDGHAWSEWWV